MAKKERTDAMTARYFIRSTPETKKALQHLAIDLNAPLEKLAGRLLADAVDRAVADFKSGKLKPEPAKG